MSTSFQIIEMLQDLREEELARVSVHRVEAMKMRGDGVRRSVASALVRVRMTIDRDAGARVEAVSERDSHRRDAEAQRVSEVDGALHW